MNNQQLDKLKNIVKSKISEAGCTYYYDVELSGHNNRYYIPVLSKNGIIYDYCKIVKKCLKHNDINTQIEEIISLCHDNAKLISLSRITPEKAQKLIDRNIALFTQIKNKIIENNLINAINEI